MGLKLERIADPKRFDNDKKNAFLRDMMKRKKKIHDISTPRKERNYPSPELAQEIKAFFRDNLKDTVAQSRYAGLIRDVELLEGEGSPGPVDAPQSVLDFAGLPVEAGPANDAGLPGVGGPAIDLASPLDPFSIHPIIPLALGLGLVLVLVLTYFHKERKRIEKFRF
uniref:Uncharacterized protein n=1 Tax=Cynodon dactylon x Cynodon transvaalensis TaxID=1920021 RepID=A0A5J6YDE5_9POAL|nr:hypothetical protein [Cynodon dactylon x Cynodon transvaalensis]